MPVLPGLRRILYMKLAGCFAYTVIFPEVPAPDSVVNDALSSSTILETRNGTSALAAVQTWNFEYNASALNTSCTLTASGRAMGVLIVLT